MTEVVRGIAYGRRFEVRVPDGLGGDVTPRLPYSWRATSAEPERVWELELFGGQHWAMVDGDVIGQWDAAPVALHMLVADLELWVAEHARNRVFVHAGCVVFAGRAIVLPGRTHSGKTTLTVELVRRGAEYFSDEFAVLGGDGRVRPYPRPLAIRSAAYELGVSTPIESIGGVKGRSPMPVGLVAHLQYDGERGWRTEDLSRGQAIMKLLDNTIPAQSRPRAVLAALERATVDTIALTGTRGDAEEAARRLLALL